MYMSVYFKHFIDAASTTHHVQNCLDETYENVDSLNYYQNYLLDHMKKDKGISHLFKRFAATYILLLFNGSRVFKNNIFKFI